MLGEIKTYWTKRISHTNLIRTIRSASTRRRGSIVQKMQRFESPCTAGTSTPSGATNADVRFVSWLSTGSTSELDETPNRCPREEEERKRESEIQKERKKEREREEERGRKRRKKEKEKEREKGKEGKKRKGAKEKETERQRDIKRERESVCACVCVCVCVCVKE